MKIFQKATRLNDLINRTARGHLGVLTPFEKPRNTGNHRKFPKDEFYKMLRRGERDFSGYFFAENIDMSNCNILFQKIHEQGDKLDFSTSKMMRMNLSGLQLSGTNFYQSDLTGADLSGAILDECNFHYSNLSFANLHGSSVIGARFSDSTYFDLSNLSELIGERKINYIGVNKPQRNNGNVIYTDNDKWNKKMEMTSTVRGPYVKK
jgi:uncharacterized protein YjbI with pentapeptide repeats